MTQHFADPCGSLIGCHLRAKIQNQAATSQAHYTNLCKAANTGRCIATCSRCKNTCVQKNVPGTCLVTCPRRSIRTHEGDVLLQYVPDTFSFVCTCHHMLLRHILVICPFVCPHLVVRVEFFGFIIRRLPLLSLFWDGSVKYSYVYATNTTEILCPFCWQTVVTKTFHFLLQ